MTSRRRYHQDDNLKPEWPRFLAVPADAVRPLLGWASLPPQGRVLAAVPGSYDTIPRRRESSARPGDRLPARQITVLAVQEPAPRVIAVQHREPADHLGQRRPLVIPCPRGSRHDQPRQAGRRISLREVEPRLATQVD